MGLRKLIMKVLPMLQKGFLFSTVAKVKLEDSEIVALHRVPCKKGIPRPILVKVQNTEVKARIMRQRPVVKKADKGYRLADDVTRLNSDLIQCLNDHEGVYQAWYWNGSVYASKSAKGRRINFDIHDDIDDKLKSIKQTRESPESEWHALPA